MNTDVLGPLLWTKAATAPGAYYRNGFTNDVETLGSRHTATNKPILNVSNAIVRLEGGNLLAPLTNDVVLSNLNRVIVVPTNRHRLVLTPSATAGTVSGSFLHPDTRRSSALQGVLLQRQRAAAGYFLGTNESGAFYFGLPEGFPLFDPDP